MILILSLSKIHEARRTHWTFAEGIPGRLMQSRYATDYAAVSQTRRHFSEARLLSATTRPAQGLLRFKPISICCLPGVMGLIIYVHNPSAFVDYSWKRGVVGSLDCLDSALGHDHLDMAPVQGRATNLQHGLNVGVTYTGSTMRSGWC